MSKGDWYEVLGVDRLATLADVKKAFRKEAHKLHPDKGGDATKFKELKTAFDEAKRCARPGNATPETKAASKPEQTTPRYPAPSSYDPFTDPNYDKYIFVQPENTKSEGFERHLFAKKCHNCHGKGYISKILVPEQGYMSIRDRLCICQKIGENTDGS